MSESKQDESVFDQSTGTGVVWTNCADEMPPNTTGKLIARYLPRPVPMVNSGCVLIGVFRAGFQSKFDWEWTPYTQEKWKELTA